MNIFLKLYSRRFFLFSLIFLFSLLLSIYAYADQWEDPNDNPPGGNIEPPINQGSTPQKKIGRFTIGGGTPGTGDYLTVFGPSKLNGLTNITGNLIVGEKVTILADSGNLIVNGISTLSTTTIIGDFGIGTDSPTNEMHIKNSSGPIINLQGPTTNYRGLRIAKSNTDNDEKWFVGANDNNDFVIRLTTSNLNAFIFSSTTGSIQLGQNSLKNCSTTKAITTNAIGELVCGTVSGSGGNTETGTSTNQTLRWNGSIWKPSSFLLNSDSMISVGTSTVDTSAAFIVSKSGKEGVRIVTVSGQSPFIIRNIANNDDFFRVRETGKVEIKGLANCSSISTLPSGELTCGSSAVASKFVGATTATTTGNNNGDPGYVAANNICSTTPFTIGSQTILGSHVCTTNEMLNTIIMGGAMPTDTFVWIFSASPGYIVRVNDCNARHSNSAAVYGSVWYTADGYGKGMITSCDSDNKLACCK